MLNILAEFLSLSHNSEHFNQSNTDHQGLSEVTACVGGARLQSHEMETKFSSTSPCHFDSSSSLVVLIEEIHFCIFIYNGLHLQ